MHETKRGRPVHSNVRANIIDILNICGKGYGYELHKYYMELFGPITRETVYYNLKKGVQLNEIDIEEIKLETGQYSWGTTVQKTYYKLGNNAKPRNNPTITQYFSKNVSLTHAQSA